MKGLFSEEALRAYSKLAAEKQGLDFAEGGSYDFTRCVRPDGSAYGTGGRCRKGTEEDLPQSMKLDSQKASGGVIAGNLFKKKEGKDRVWRSSGLKEAETIEEVLNALKKLTSRNPFNKKERAQKALEASGKFVDLIRELNKEKGDKEALKVIKNNLKLVKLLAPLHFELRHAVYGEDVDEVPARIRQDSADLSKMSRGPSSFVRSLK